MCSLTDRVALLESMLKERGETPPPANYPPKTRHGAPPDGEPESKQQSKPKAPPSNVDHSSPGSHQEDFFDIDHVDQDGSSHRADDAESAPSPPVLTTQ